MREACTTNDHWINQDIAAGMAAQGSTQLGCSSGRCLLLVSTMTILCVGGTLLAMRCLVVRVLSTAQTTVYVRHAYTWHARQQLQVVDEMVAAPSFDLVLCVLVMRCAAGSPQPAESRRVHQMLRIELLSFYLCDFILASCCTHTPLSFDIALLAARCTRTSHANNFDSGMSHCFSRLPQIACLGMHLQF
jgi:hypothetical protein